MQRPIMQSFSNVIWRWPLQLQRCSAQSGHTKMAPNSYSNFGAQNQEVVRSSFLRSLVTAISSYLWFFVNSWWCVSPQGCLGLIYSTVVGGGERDLLSICDILFNCYRCWFSARFTLNYFILLITLLCMSRSSVIHNTATASLYQKTELLTVATFGYFPNYSVSLKCNYKTDYGN